MKDKKQKREKTNTTRPSPANTGWSKRDKHISLSPHVLEIKWLRRKGRCYKN